MRIAVDWDRCEGHGLCTHQAPTVFDLDDEGELTYHYDGSEIPAELAAAARSAVGSCPVAALREQI